MSLAENAPRAALPQHEFESYAAVAQYVKNKLRHYNLISIIKLCLNHLHRTHADGVEALRHFPWLAALVTKLALEDKMVEVSVGPDCPRKVFEQCCNELWAFHSPKMDESVHHLLLTVRGMLHAQMLFQKNSSTAYLRWPALIERVPADHPSAELFRNAFNMSPVDFMLSATAVMSSLIHYGYSKPLSLSVFSKLPETVKANLNSFLLMFCKSALGLREILRNELKQRIDSGGSPRPPYERLEFPWLANYPLLRLEDNKVLAWHPLIFYQGIENAVHNRLSFYGQQYSDDFSKLFESYVVELIEESGTKPIIDSAFKQMGNASMSAVDALIPSRNGNVLIEAKMSLFSDELLISDKPNVVYQKLKRIRKALSQAWKVGDLLRNGSVSINEADQAEHDYLFIVTSRQILLGNGTHLREMVNADFFDSVLPEGNFGRPSDEQLRRLPPQNITILSIEEFEHLVGAVIEGKLTFLSYAEDAAKRALDKKTAVMTADQITAKYVDKWYIPTMIKTAQQRITEQFHNHFSVQP